MGCLRRLWGVRRRDVVRLDVAVRNLLKLAHFDLAQVLMAADPHHPGRFEEVAILRSRFSGDGGGGSDEEVILEITPVVGSRP